jgi:galactokinase
MREDLRAFRQTLEQHRDDLFRRGEPIHIARAPGRLDVMGGVADYSGSLVLEATIEDATIAGVQLRQDRRVRVVSDIAREGRVLTVEADLDSLLTDPALGYGAARARLIERGLAGWPAYVLGAWCALSIEGLLPPAVPGASVFLRSTVPIAVGVASSAALEVAATYALASALAVRLAPLDLARLCQRVENLIAGAPCGVMDQVACALGRAGAPVIILCQPHDVRGHLVLPAGLATFGIDSSVEKHTSGSPYRRARVAAFMGHRILSSLLGASAGDGYLANVTPEGFRSLADRLPARMRGDEFLGRYGGTDDPVTSVDPAVSYSVRGCTEHPIYENRRVARFIELLGAPEASEAARIEAGALMYGSHWSYTHRCSLGHRDVTRIVRLARGLGPERGIYGAKITGGGAGGTVAILARADAHEAVEEIAETYRRETGRDAIVFAGTSPGAVQSGITLG